jgi:CNT family concentrative nucleoside transporter
VLGILPNFGGEAITMQRILGYVMAPVTWLMGIPWSEAATAGKLLGTKTVLNEVVAFLELSKVPRSDLSAHSALIMTYALCGFANFSAIGIIIGGIGTMVPERRDEIVALGIKSVFAGTLATCMSGTLIGILTHLSGDLIK